ncbi:DUF364 domain-containing protein [Thermococcus aggregans]|uniref:DUF364 domain-containing protein n=1 Tax=Thermococcus aggregans TaxID=110163 RepID=A0A9E7SNP9_THEAG|nr:DUF364 domain-containing protein [Thermococcus aggregans]USS40554.1 DUF364 domain-containing protein [Thermococcus aggregans]
MMLRLLKKRALKAMEEDFKLVDFFFALPYTYVVIEGEKGKAVGLVMTLPEEINEYKNTITGASLRGFIEKADSLNIIERTLGLAAINAVSQYYLEVDAERNVLDLVEEEKVAVIGNMLPLVQALREKGKEVFVFERNPKLWDRETLSDALEYVLLPEMEAVIVSGSALLNCTIDMIVERSNKAKKIILVGATAQGLPEFFKGTGVTHLASVKVENVEKAIISLKLGSFRGFGEQSKKYVIEV